MKKLFKIVPLGPGVEMKIRPTEDGQGFEILISGRFRSGENEQATIKQIQGFWETLDIDA
jgi:hypothetical protein